MTKTFYIQPTQVLGCGSCACNGIASLCRCGNYATGNCPGRLGEAKGGTNLNPNRNSSATRAKAFVNWVKNTNVRTAGGTYLGNNDLVEFVQQVHQMNIDVARQVFKYTTTPGLIYSIYQAGSGTKAQIENRMQNDPDFKRDVQNVTKKVLTTGSDVWDMVTGPIKGVTTTITWLPYIVIGGLILAAVFAFSNPGSVSTPRRISLV